MWLQVAGCWVLGLESAKYGVCIEWRWLRVIYMRSPPGRGWGGLKLKFLMFGTEPAPEGLNIYSKNETKMILRRITMVINETIQLPALPGKKMRGRMVDEETEGRRDGGTKRRRDEETKRRRDEETKRRRDGGI
jgi:hypothetical protein